MAGWLTPCSRRSRRNLSDCERCLGPAPAALFEVLLQIEIFVLDVQTGMHAVWDHAGSKLPGPDDAAGLIGDERGFVVSLQAEVLVFFMQEAPADGERLDFRSHEAAECVLRRADDRFTPYVEARVDDDGTAGALFEHRY